tara:strand:- start:1247 stop:2041 length:795 start_codon:yes stop_codon:yes gene_type:complete
LDYFEFILYGLIQGFTEFFPISSTAHLKVISLLLGINDPGPSLSAVIQFGSVFAILWYFKNDFFKNNQKKNFFDYSSHKKFLISIFIATIPIVFLGGSIKIFAPIFFDKILRSNLSIAIISFVMAFYMYRADISKKGFINIKNHNYSDSLFIGFSQAFSILPGVSRSGITISSALLSGWEEKDAVKFSFILGMPAISLAAIVESISSLDVLISSNFFPLLVGIATAFLSSLIAIKFLLTYLPSNGMKLFIYYRVIFGVVILLNL